MKSAEKTYNAKRLKLEELLKISDYSVALAALTESTIHMIGEKEFDMMKETAVFINSSSGKLVYEKALIEALRKGEVY